jgi:competence protein ComEA
MIPKITAVLVISLFAGLSWAQVELNKATEIDLDGLKGVGPSLTRQVINERQKGAFADWADVMHRIKGIGPKKANSLSEQGLRVQGQLYAPSAPALQQPASAPNAPSISCCHTR